jgi:hypothetical protein
MIVGRKYKMTAARITGRSAADSLMNYAAQWHQYNNMIQRLPQSGSCTERISLGKKDTTCIVFAQARLL